MHLLLATQEGQDNPVVERRIVAVHPMSSVRNHHVRLSIEAAFELAGDEEEHGGTSLPAHEENGPLQLGNVLAGQRGEIA